MSLLSLVLAWSGVLESLLATIGIAGMCAGIAYAWAGVRNGMSGIRVIRPPRKRTEPRHGSWLSVVGLRFSTGCLSLAVLRMKLKNVIHLRDTKTTGDFQCLNCSNSKLVMPSYY